VNASVRNLTPDYAPFVRPTRDGGLLEVLVKGAHCARCLAKIEGEVSAIPGVDYARLNLTAGKLSVGLTARTAAPAEVFETLERLGYEPTPYAPKDAVKSQDDQGRKLLLALTVAGFGAGNAMIFSVPLWAGLFGQELGPATRTFMQICSGAIGVPCALYAGMPFFKSAWRSLKARRANMDVPISLGVLLTLGLSVVETVTHGRDTYFDAAVSLLFLLLIGRWLDYRLRAKARSAAGEILALQARACDVVGRDGRERRTLTEDVLPGDRVRIRPGERLPVDAVIVEGTSALDNALLTGESIPLRVGPGDICHAGAINQSGVLLVRATARSEDSTLTEIARLVEAGAQSRSKYVRLADKAAAIYVPVVHCAALATFLIGAVFLGVHAALIRAVAVLIITCPCALGLAVPAVQVTASARLFHRKVLLKSGAALERLAEVDTVVFDKTGVLTLGRPVLVEGPTDLLAMAAQLARASAHPLSKALAAADGRSALADEVQEHPGQGVAGRIDGRPARLGSAAFLDHDGGVGEMELWFAFDGEPPVRYRFEDGLRLDAADTVRALQRRGLTVRILSGDRTAVVQGVAAAVGITDWAGQRLPTDKAATVAELSRNGHRVLMVGDGFNDTAALAAAHCAMAPGTALDASQNAADLIFLGDELMAVVSAVDIAKAARARALENFGFSALYNLIAAPAAMLGLLNPLLAALAMSGSSMIVTLNALRITWAGRAR